MNDAPIGSRLSPLPVAKMLTCTCVLSKLFRLLRSKCCLCSSEQLFFRVQSLPVWLLRTHFRQVCDHTPWHRSFRMYVHWQLPLLDGCFALSLASPFLLYCHDLHWVVSNHPGTVHSESSPLPARFLLDPLAPAPWCIMMSFSRTRSTGTGEGFAAIRINGNGFTREEMFPQNIILTLLNGYWRGPHGAFLLVTRACDLQYQQRRCMAVRHRCRRVIAATSEISDRRSHSTGELKSMRSKSVDNIKWSLPCSTSTLAGEQSRFKLASIIALTIHQQSDRSRRLNHEGRRDVPAATSLVVHYE